MACVEGACCPLPGSASSKKQGHHPVTHSLMLASGLGVNVRSLRHQERKWGMIGALTFIYNRVGRKAEEKLGVGRKLQGLVREKKPSHSETGTLKEIRRKKTSGSCTQSSQHQQQAPTPQHPLLPRLQINQREGGHSRRQGGARSNRKGQHGLVGKPHSTHLGSPAAHCPKSR